MPLCWFRHEVAHIILKVNWQHTRSQSQVWWSKCLFFQLWFHTFQLIRYHQTAKKEVKQWHRSKYNAEGMAQGPEYRSCMIKTSTGVKIPEGSNQFYWIQILILVHKWTTDRGKMPNFLSNLQCNTDSSPQEKGHTYLLVYTLHFPSKENTI